MPTQQQQPQHKQILQNMSNQLFEVQEKLTSQEYKDLYENMMKLHRLPSFNTTNNAVIMAERTNNIMRDSFATVIQNTQREIRLIQRDRSIIIQDHIKIKKELEEAKKIADRYKQSYNQLQKINDVNFQRLVQLEKKNIELPIEKSQELIQNIILQLCTKPKKASKPKRAPRANGWNLFYKENLNVIRSRYLDISGRDAMKKVSEAWRNLPVEEKIEWKEKAKALISA
jgi:hypothetical protein